MLIGRESERRVIEPLIAGARVGQSGVLVLVGEAGIGKTALLDWAASQGAGMAILRATGIEAEREVPFGGLLQLLRPVLDLIDGLPAPRPMPWRPPSRCAPPQPVIGSPSAPAP